MTEGMVKGSGVVEWDSAEESERKAAGGKDNVVAPLGSPQGSSSSSSCLPSLAVARSTAKRNMLQDFCLSPSYNLSTLLPKGCQDVPRHNPVLCLFNLAILPNLNRELTLWCPQVHMSQVSQVSQVACNCQYIPSYTDDTCM